MRRVLLCLVLLALVAGVASAQTPVTPAPAQTVNATVAAAYSISVTPASVNLGNFQSGIASCLTDATTVVTIQSSSTWSLTVKSDATGIFLRTGAGIALGSPLQVAGGSVPFTNISGVELALLSAQAPTASQAVPTQYKQCSLVTDGAGSYSLGVIYTLRP